MYLELIFSNVSYSIKSHCIINNEAFNFVSDKKLAVLISQGISFGWSFGEVEVLM